MAKQYSLYLKDSKGFFKVKTSHLSPATIKKEAKRLHALGWEVKIRVSGKLNKYSSKRK